ncbi:hypothetical protein VTH06DRAFT_7368 [Thermothelomyces fergusii]
MDIDRASHITGKHEADHAGRDPRETDMNIHEPGQTSYNNDMDVDGTPGPTKAENHTPADSPLNAETAAKPTGTPTPTPTPAPTGTGRARTATGRTPLPTSRPPLPPAWQKAVNASAPPAGGRGTRGARGGAAAAAEKKDKDKAKQREKKEEAAEGGEEDGAEDQDGAPWTHQETIKLLLMRCKQFAVERMVEVLPGRDVAACMDRLAQIAVRHGYEAYI